jgi:CheY-like chemotaxis protein
MERNPRILIIDDTRDIHECFRRILCWAPVQPGALEDLESQLFGTPVARQSRQPFELDSAYQGQEGLDLVQAALGSGRPYALAFVDVRMPPGWDGIETSARIWQVDPDLQIVICTAFADYSWEQMVDKLGATDRLVILKKPFETVEALQLASALTEKWRLHQEAKHQLEHLETLVRERTRVLEETNAKLTQALANVQTLSGLIPICSGCKKVRDDRGFWSQVEAYVAEHSDATFTHGLCPECAGRYYPGMAYPTLTAS